MLGGEVGNCLHTREIIWNFSRKAASQNLRRRHLVFVWVKPITVLPI